MEKLTSKSEHISVSGHIGKWYVVEDGWFKKDGGELTHVFLLEHETYGDMAGCVIVDEDVNLVMDDVFNGFSDLEENGWLESADDDPGFDNLLWDILKKHIGHDVSIVCYGEKDDPADICLECNDCNEVILDAEIYTICTREDG